MRLNTPRLLALLAITGGLAACSDGTGGPSTGSQVTFNIGTRASDGAPLQSFLSDTFTTGGTDTLVLDKVEVVLRDIRFKRVEDSGCPDDDHNDSTVTTLMGGDGSHHDGEHGDGGDDDGHDGHNDACESFKTGPLLLDLPLGPGVQRAFSVAVDTGTFNELRVKIHAPRTDSADAADVAFLAAHPDFEGVSIRATGTFNGTPFTYTTNLNAKERVRLIPPITVADSMSNVDVTIKVDLAGWFKDAGGNFINPETGNAGGANENVVKDNIKDSFHAFHDGNHDCHNDSGGDND